MTYEELWNDLFLKIRTWRNICHMEADMQSVNTYDHLLETMKNLKEEQGMKKANEVDAQMYLRKYQLVKILEGLKTGRGFVTIDDIIKDLNDEVKDDNMKVLSWDDTDLDELANGTAPKDIPAIMKDILENLFSAIEEESEHECEGCSLKDHCDEINEEDEVEEEYEECECMKEDLVDFISKWGLTMTIRNGFAVISLTPVDDEQ